MDGKKCLVAVEGIDGSGKSIQVELLRMGLEQANHPAVITKAKQPHQEAALKNFVKTFAIKSDSMAFMLLYQALHREQYEKTVAALAEGKVVIADRWNTSFFVYHGLTGPLAKRSPQLLEMLDGLAFEDLTPDVFFFIDTPVEIAIERRIARGDRIACPAKERAFYARVSEEYKKLFAEKPGHHRIDGTLPVEAIALQMIAITLAHVRG